MESAARSGLSKTRRFGSFEVDLASGELRKKGLRIRLQDQPFQVLAALLETPGEVVSREDLILRLWPDGTVVDYDRGLNAAVTRLRQALSDSADVPRYVETVARRGYRFIGVLDGPPVGPAIPARVNRRWMWPAAAALGVTALAAGWAIARGGPAFFDRPMKVSLLTSGPGVERVPSFSPDGSQIAYEWDKGDGKPHIYIKLIGAGDPIRLTSLETADYGPAWSPDGRQIAFLRRLSDSTVAVYVTSALGGLERKLAANPAPEVTELSKPKRRLSWTPDSRYLVVSGRVRPDAGEGLFLVPVDGGERVWLTQPPEPSPPVGDREPAVSPDGRTVAFARGIAGTSEHIYLLPLTKDYHAAGEPRPVENAKGARSPAWTPDGREIVYASQSAAYDFNSPLWSISLAPGAKPRTLAAAGWNVTVPAVSATGRIAWAPMVRASSIWRQEIPTGSGPAPPAERLTPSNGQSANPQYSPDGSRFAFGSNRSGSLQIWTCASDGTRCLPLTDVAGPYVTGSPRWSPDGGRIAFDSSSEGGSDIWVVDSNGGPPRCMTRNISGSVTPSWSHDGRWIYFARFVSGGPQIFKMPSEGGQAVQLTRNGGFVPFESMDGRFLYYLKGEQKPELFRSAIDGADETAIVKNVVWRGYAVAADRIYYLSEPKPGAFEIRERVLASGGDRQIATIPGRVFLGLTLSPDGRYLAYTRLDQMTSIIMLADPVSAAYSLRK